MDLQQGEGEIVGLRHLSARRIEARDDRVGGSVEGQRAGFDEELAQPAEAILLPIRQFELGKPIGEDEDPIVRLDHLLNRSRGELGTPERRAGHRE